MFKCYIRWQNQNTKLYGWYHHTYVENTFGKDAESKYTLEFKSHSFNKHLLWGTVFWGIVLQPEITVMSQTSLYPHEAYILRRRHRQTVPRHSLVVIRVIKEMKCDNILEWCQQWGTWLGVWIEGQESLSDWAGQI